MNAVILLADNAGLDDGKVKLVGDVEVNEYDKIGEVLDEYKEVLDGSVGKYNGGAVSIETDKEAKPILFKPYRVLDSLKVKVKEAGPWIVDVECLALA